MLSHQLVGDSEQVDKFNRRLVKVTRTHMDECKRLLSLMGVPYVEVILKLANDLMIKI